MSKKCVILHFRGVGQFAESAKRHRCMCVSAFSGAARGPPKVQNTHFPDLKSVCSEHFCPPGMPPGGPPEARNLVFPKENQGFGHFPRVAPGMRFLRFPLLFPRECKKGGIGEFTKSAKRHRRLCVSAFSGAARGPPKVQNDTLFGPEKCVFWALLPPWDVPGGPTGGPKPCFS